MIISRANIDMIVILTMKKLKNYGVKVRQRISEDHGSMSVGTFAKKLRDLKTGVVSVLAAFRAAFFLCL